MRFSLAVLCCFAFATLCLANEAKERSAPYTQVPHLGTNRGREFWLGFPTSILYYGSGVGLRLTISSVDGASVTVDAPGLAFTMTTSVPPGGTSRVDVPIAAMCAGDEEGTEAKGIHITADRPIAVYASYDNPTSSDMFTALPVESVSTSYLILSKSPTMALNGNSTLAIAATADSTTITIRPSVPVHSHAAGQSFFIRLNAGQVYHLRTPDLSQLDLTGTTVTSNRPIAVYSGASAAQWPLNRCCSNTLMEQLPPVLALGKSFITVPFKTRIGDQIRCCAFENDTHISVDGQPFATLAAGQWIDQIKDSPSSITSDKGIFVVQYACSTGFDSVKGDPTMVVVPPVQAYASDCLVQSDALGEVDDHYLNVVAPNDAVGFVMLDGNPVVGFLPMPGTTYSYAQLTVSAGTHAISAPVGMQVGVTAYGFGYYDAYSFPGGLDFSRVDAEMFLNVSPSLIAGGGSSTGIVRLPFGAPPGGATVSLTSSDPVAQVPATVVVPEGLDSATFPISSSGVTTQHTATITAAVDSVQARTTLDVIPNTVSAFTFDPNPIGGGSTGRGSVVLVAPAPAGGASVTLTNINPTIVTVPSAVTVPAGSMSATFSVGTKGVSSNVSVAIIANLNNTPRQALLLVTPVHLAAFALSSNSAFERFAVVGTVTLDGPAPSGGAVVALSNSNANAVSMPTSVTVPQGAKSKTFTVTCKTVTSPQATTLRASWRSATYQQQLSVAPIALSNLHVISPTLTGGLNTNAVVSIPFPAPSGGVAVSLGSSASSAASVPTVITIPQGASSATFVISTHPVTGTSFVTVKAAHATSTLSTQIQVLPPEVNTFKLSSATVRGRSNVTGTVSLTGRAPTGGVQVQITAYPNLAWPAASVTVAAGATSVSFTIHTAAVGATTAVSVTARTFSQSRQALLTLTP